MPYHTPLIIEHLDGKIYRLMIPLVYEYKPNNTFYTVPEGFVTNFASVPRFLWALFPPTGEYSPATVVHDWMYYYGIGNKKLADKIFLHAMEELNVSWLTRRIMYRSVVLFGSGNYNA